MQRLSNENSFGIKLLKMVLSLSILFSTFISQPKSVLATDNEILEEVIEEIDSVVQLPVEVPEVSEIIEDALDTKIELDSDVEVSEEIDSETEEIDNALGEFLGASSSNFNNYLSVGEYSTGIKPQIDLKYLGTTPSNPMVGQSFKVSYELIPQPFKHQITTEKEIVLVLDGSGSMSGDKLKNLKKAAKTFISSLSSVENLKIGIVVYSSEATINPYQKGNENKKISTVDAGSHSVPSYISLSTPYFLDVNDSKLINMIDNITALGGTNTGEGLRKAEFLLDKGNPDANKTIILMSDGVPTFYSTEKVSCGWYCNEYKNYLKIDNESPLISGSGQEKNTNVNNSTGYATNIGTIIKPNNYNIFSIGYDLDDKGNQKLQEIHRSMGGVVDLQNPENPNNTFFASDTGAIDAVFKKIADKLEQSYSFNDAQLNLNLPSTIVAGEGFTSVDDNGNTIKINPIIYELRENNWYKAESQIIEFYVTANEAGEFKLFKEGSTISYKDIEGNLKEFPVPNPTITIRPYEVSESEKLQVDFGAIPDSYLIGDEITSIVTFIHPGTEKVKFTNAKFTLGELPSHINLRPGYTKELIFGDILSTNNKNYNLMIDDSSEITVSESKEYHLSGKYSYLITNGTSKVQESGEETTVIKVKRGQVRVKVRDESGQDITHLSTISIKGSQVDKLEGQLNDDYILFNTLSSGNYELRIEDLPEGCYPTEGENNAIVKINYDNNLGEYIFNVQGTATGISTQKIEAELKEVSPTISTAGDEVRVTYTIKPSDFIDNSTGESTEKMVINEVVFVVDLSTNMNLRNRWNGIVNELTNVLLNDSELQTNEFKFGIVGFNSGTVFSNNPSQEYYRKLFNIGNSTEKESFRKVLQDSSYWIRPSNNVVERNIGEALKEADRILSNQQTDVGKAIVLISTDKVSYNETELQAIRNKGYKIISVYLGSEISSDSNSSSLSSAHVALGGTYIENDENDSDDFFISKTDGNYNFIAEDMKKVKKALLGGVVDNSNPTYIFNDIKLNFDIGDEFEAISNLLCTDRNICSVQIPSITYTGQKLNDSDFYRYSANSFDIDFTIKIESEKTGDLPFSQVENIDVTNISYQDITKPDDENGPKGLINTPIIKVIEIDHGLYGGIIKETLPNETKISTINVIPSGKNDSQDEIKELMGESTVNFVAKVRTASKLPILTLNIDKSMKDITLDNIKIFDFDSNNGVLTPLSDAVISEVVNNSTAENLDVRQFSIKLPEELPSNSTVVILYSGIVPNVKGGIYSNNFNLEKISEQVRIKSKMTIDEENNSLLPNLF